MTTVRIKGIEWLIDRDGDWIKIKVPSAREARTICEAVSAKLAEGIPFIAEIKKASRKRSLTANGYLWTLCDQISAKLAKSGLAVSPEEIYRKHVKIGGVREYFAVRESAVERTKERWEKRGTGWFVEIIDDCKINGCKKILLYYGSSVYTVEEMNRLLTSVVQEAQDLGIETLTGAELALLKEG